jgi:phospholipase/carboxylesterase
MQILYLRACSYVTAPHAENVDVNADRANSSPILANISSVDESSPEVADRISMREAQADDRWLDPVGSARVALILLHGLDMTPAQLAPLLASLKLPACIVLPAGPVRRPGGHRAWWPVDDAARAARLVAGPADLHDSHPPGRDLARATVQAAAQALHQRAPGVPLLLAGFSQGAMLALDCVLQSPPLIVQGLALWSASRLAFTEWAPRLHRLQDVPVQLVHGRADTRLGLHAGLALRDALAAEGAVVRWSPFDGGHEIPLQAWVGLRRLVRDLSDAM